ncbi:hypothetical protein [Weissella viridescens]|uniref:hypothetical protein n=1 Tax=Weissella viridescens TaxID=1629 RepID=UPI0040570ACA
MDQDNLEVVSQAMMDELENAKQYTLWHFLDDIRQDEESSLFPETEAWFNEKNLFENREADYKLVKHILGEPQFKAKAVEMEDNE